MPDKSTFSAKQANPVAPILLSMGDPCGIGPELIAQVFAQGHGAGIVITGSAARIAQAGARWGVSVAGFDAPAAGDESAWWAGWAQQSRQLPQRSGMPGALPAHVIPVVEAAPGAERLPWGKCCAEGGEAAYQSLMLALRLQKASPAQAALVTAPLHKGALHLAGHHYPGHTEILQAFAGHTPVRMMLANEALRVVLVSIHVSLREAIERVDIPGVLETVRIAHASLTRMLGRTPHLAVAGLNPHAGEGGLFGSEEQRIIAPAIEQAKALDIHASGPYAPDTVFAQAHQGAFDAVIAMYHDQGLIPVKYMGLEHGVNVTLGLPFVRTSPDHGTAFDIAGQGRCDVRSTLAAIRMARQFSPAPQN